MRNPSLEAFVIVDNQYRIVMANESFSQTLSFLTGKNNIRIGDSLPDLLISPGKEELVANLETAFNGRQLELERESVTNIKDKFIFSITIFPLLKEEKVTSVLIIIRDITETRKIEQSRQALLRRYNLATSAINLGVFEMDLTTGEAFWDDNLYNMFEVRPGTPINIELWRSFMQPAYREKTLDKFYTAIKNKEAGVKFEVQATTAKGNEKYIISKMLFLQDESGNINRVIGANWDVTEQEKAKEKLSQSELKMRVLLQSTKEGFCLYDKEMILMLMNEQGEKYTRMKSGKVPVPGQHVSEFTREEEIENVIGIMQEILEGRSPVVERNIPDKESLLWLHMTYTPVKENNVITGVCVVARDVTNLVRSREEIIAARQRAEQSEQLQEQFLATMSHEIRTPLNGIIGMGQMLLDTPLSTEQSELLNTILNSSDTLLFLINDILDLSKIKAGKFRIEKTEMDVFQIVEKTSFPFQTKAQEKGIRFSVMMDPFIPKKLTGDQHRLKQILNNLLSNAIKFTNEGSVKLEIELSEKTDTGVWLNITVSDTGIGIEEEKLQFVFESFTQEGSDTARKFGGTGLGLAITKRLTEMQGGNITAFSTKGKGSRFVVNIPYEIAHESKSQQEPETTSVKENLKFTGRRVLVVEDNLINQQVFSHLLKDFEIQVTLAKNGKQAIETLETNAVFDLILLDLRMPEMDGFQTLAYIRQKLKLQTPVFVLTASVLQDERQRCLELGATDYLSKPIPRPVLQQRLAQLFTSEPTEETQQQQSYHTTDIDMKTLLSLRDKKIIHDIYSDYIKTVPASLEEIKESATENDWIQVGTLVHKLKSSLNVINIKALTRSLNEVEDKISDQHTSDVLPVIEKAITLYKEALPELEQKIAIALK